MAAWYSIVGLTAIFAAAVIPIIIMGSILEVAKVTVTVWLHEYWHRCRWQMKLYLVPAVVMLMVITSMGIFGFLSKAHTDQALISGDVMARIAIYDEKIRTEKENIDANRKALKQLDEAVDQVMGRSTSETGAERAVQIRRSQQAERGRLLKEIEQSQKRITAFNEERAPIAAEVRKVEAEVGPIKYIAALVYGDNPDANLLERAVRWVIIILVVVFDPLAIMMVLAATESIKWERESRRQPGEIAVEESNDPETPRLAPEPEVPPAQDPSPPGWMFDTLPYLKDGAKMFFTDLKPMVASTSKIDSDEAAEESEKEAIRQWKAAHPETTIKAQRDAYESGQIDHLPWEQYLTGRMRGHGTQFPEDAVKGDSYLRVDQVPSQLYKFNGSKWIVVDKSLSDQYAYNDAYIDHLIAKIGTGEYDPDLLTNAEREQVETRLTNKKSA